MKYIIELEKIEGTNLHRAKGASTLVFDECGIKNILKPLPEPEVDWTKIEVDTPILVSQNNETWKNRHFAKFKHGKVFAWGNGKTSFSADRSFEYVDWKYAKLAEVEE